MFLCILIIFAQCCQLPNEIPPEQQEASAEVFFVPANGLLNLTVWQVSSFLAVPAFLPLAQYLQSTNDSHQCWIAGGLAIRTAQSLGLNLPETSDTVSSRTRGTTAKSLGLMCHHGSVRTYVRPPCHDRQELPPLYHFHSPWTKNTYLQKLAVLLCSEKTAPCSISSSRLYCFAMCFMM